MATRGIWCALAFSMLACSSGGGNGTGNGTGGGGGTGGGNLSTEYVGAWDAHDSPASTFEVFCLIFCDNGRAFTGQAECSETSEFPQYKTWSSVGKVITLTETNDPAVTLEAEELSGDAATFRLDGISVPFTRTAPTSPLCTSTEVTPD